LTNDAARSKAFYDDVIGWNIAADSGAAGMDYRMIATRDGSFVGGMMPLTDKMRSGGAKPTWLFYIGVDDVDAAAELIVAKGGSIHLAPFEIPQAGRAAMVADPQGNPFYIMRGSSPDASTAWDRTGMGKCNWNELATSDQAAGNAFYADVFGWNYPDKMAMPGDMGDYTFIDAAGQTIGATMKAGIQPGQPLLPRARYRDGGGEGAQERRRRPCWPNGSARRRPDHRRKRSPGRELRRRRTWQVVGPRGERQ